jgi:hypothetical protein
VLIEAPDQELPRADIFYSNGVLHHTPDAASVLRSASQSCTEARLMLYSDRAWRHHTNSEPPADVTGDPGFERYVRAMDAVGDYADWWSPEKLAQAVEGFWRVERFEYLPPHGHYLTAALA